MKKTLAIVLALAMVLCMIPASFADSTTNKTISDKSYQIKADSVYTAAKDHTIDPDKTIANNANSLTIKYNYEEETDETTGKFTENRKMALVWVVGFVDDLKGANDVKIYIDGKELSVNDKASYKDRTGWDSVNGAVCFPVELTKSGYTESFLIEVTGKNGDVNIKETAKISLKFENTADYKNARTATISKIESLNNKFDAYIVGSKIYLDFVDKKSDVNSTNFVEDLEITFKDDNGDLFDTVTWAYNPSSDAGKRVSVFKLEAADGEKLEDSKIQYSIPMNLRYTDEDNFTGVSFELETASAIYETKEYDVVCRYKVVEADPKGIYFAESSKTIKIGEEYTPVVMGVATSKKVDADLEPGKGTDKQVIDIDGDTIIGTQEGVAYITAEYMPAITENYGSNEGVKYTSNSMKIVVVNKKVDDDTTDGKTYMVTASSLRVRSGAGTNFSQIGSLKNGATVKVESIANGWAKLENGGYVSAQYLAEVVDNGEAQTMYVTARTLNVRKGPGTSYAKVGTLSRGTAVQVVGFSGNWAKLSNGYYVSTSYLAK